MLRRIVLCVVVFTVAWLPMPSSEGYAFPVQWRDQHRAYPPVPSGSRAIVSTFGQPCNAKARVNTMKWIAADNRHAYPLSYHEKLGGWGVFYGGRKDPGASSNLNNDVRGHLTVDNLDRYITHGIYGYACRKIRGSSKWSTHAWGIAVDINTAANPYPTSACKGLPSSVISTWTRHGWRHGKAFSDCMHFQYATNY